MGTGLRPAPTNTSPPPPTLIAGTPFPNVRNCGVHGVPGIPMGTFGGVGSGRGGSQTLPPSIDDRPTVGIHVHDRDTNAPPPRAGLRPAPTSGFDAPHPDCGDAIPKRQELRCPWCPRNPPAGTRQRAPTADSPHTDRNAASCLRVSGRRNPGVDAARYLWRRDMSLPLFGRERWL